MKEICLSGVVPEVFKHREDIVSDVWRQDVFFSKGEFYLLEAVSGAGKSSLCSYIYGYRSDYIGKIRFDREDCRSFSISRWSEWRKNSLSILFQDLRLFPELTALENVVLKNNLTGFKSENWIHDCFDRLGLPDKKEAPVGKLSFGQQQRVAIVRALCQPFDFLLLDEPVSHLDEQNNRLVGELLRQEVKAQGAGMIVTSIGKHPFIEYDKIGQL